MASTSITRSISSTSAIKKFTLSMWVKRGGLGSYQRMFGSDGGTGDTYFRFQNNDAIEWSGHASDATAAGLLTTSRLFRDTSAWYHFVIKVDTTQSTASDRLKFWVNGVLETAFSAETMPNQDVTDNIVNTSKTHRISGTSSAQYLDGSIAHFHFTQGYAYDASTFGEFDSTSGIWKPKTAPSVTYGTNGFFLKFENSGNLDLDSSGNNLTFSTSGTLTQNVDTPTNNYATLNPLARDHSDTASLTNGNLTHSLSNYSLNARSSLAMTAGKWYWEFKQSAVNNRAGMCTSGFNPNLDTDDTNAYSGHATGRGGVYNMNTGAGTSWQRTNNDTSKNVDTPSGTALASGANDIISCAMDVGTGKFHVAVNGTWLNSGNPATGANPQITLTNSSGDPLHVFSGFNTSNAMTTHFNFGSGYFGTTAVASANADGNGHGAFEYAVPSGFYALNSKNLKEFG